MAVKKEVAVEEYPKELVLLVDEKEQKVKVLNEVQEAAFAKAGFKEKE